MTRTTLWKSPYGGVRWRLMVKSEGGKAQLLILGGRKKKVIAGK